MSNQKYKVIKLTLTDNNLLEWTDDDLLSLTKNNKIIGYLVYKAKTTNTLTLYVIDSGYKDSVTLKELQAAYKITNLQYEINNKPVSLFKNPPLELWLNTKKEWIKKITYRLSQKYNMSYDETLSLVYYAIVKLYNKTTIYMGNLNYLSMAANCEIMMDHRYYKNRLTLNNDSVISLDESFEIDGTMHTKNEIFGEEDSNFVNEDFIETTNEIKKVLRYKFSEREIDQIINAQGQLPQGLYRRLLDWRKQHKRQDFNV